MPEPGDRQHAVYSFDVFDTCITRACAYPRDIFYELGLKLAPAGLAIGETRYFARRFQAARIRAEKKAYRTARPRGGTTIYDIYACFLPPHGLNTPPSDIAEAEIELERKYLYAVPKVADRINQLRQSGCRIVFVSDMYLPARILAPILQNLAVMDPGDKLYVSCDLHATKHSGELFKRVLEIEDLKPSDLAHMGDNLWSDVSIPRKIGIAAQHFAETTLNDHEIRITERMRQSEAENSFIAAQSKCSRLLQYDNQDLHPHPMDPLIHSTFAPLLIAYMGWVLEQAKQAGIKRLYFVARDGEVMHKIASIWMEPGSDIELRYLYGSRKAWLSPSIIPESSTWRKLVATPKQSNTYSDLLSRMGLESGLQSRVMEMLGVENTASRRTLTQSEAYSFLEDALKNRAVADIVFDTAGRARALAADYLRQEGLLDDVPWALVDSGWSLNCQAALKRILSAVKGEDYSPRGYYLAFAGDRLDYDEAGTAHSFIPKTGSLFSRRRVIFEHCFTASTHPTTKSYALQAGQVVPTFGAELRSSEELAYAERLHRIVESSTRLICSDPQRKQRFLSCREIVIRNAENFISRPSAEDAEKMRVFGVIADVRHDERFVQPLCSPLGIKDLWSATTSVIAKKRSFNTASIMWLEGSGAISPIYIRIPLRIMLWVDSMLGKLKSL